MQQLVNQGAEVVGLVRTQPAGMLSGQQCRLITGDIRDMSAVRRALSGADRVFHLAAATSPRTLAASRAVTVEGTRNLAAAACALPTPPVIIYVSSLAAAGPNRVAATESMTCRPVSIYGQTKLEAEAVLGEFAARIPMTILRPPGVFGPGDRNLLSLFKTVRRGWNFYTDPDHKYSFLYVDDLIDALTVACERGLRLTGRADPQHSGVYYVTDPQAVTFPELAELIAECLHRPSVRQIRIPRCIGWSAAALGDLMQQAFGSRVYFNRDKAREAYSGSWTCDAARAREQLRWAPAKDLAQRLSDTRASYAADGWL